MTNFLSQGSLIPAAIYHRRHHPVINQFMYNVFYLSFPLKLYEKNLKTGGLLGINQKGIFSIYQKDYGPSDGSSLKKWVENSLQKMKATDLFPKNEWGEFHLMTMPRVFGYQFNPVSFYLCHDKKKKLRVVIAEVHNTFGENHSYLCQHPKGKTLDKNALLKTKKVFHVSPFLPLQGSYKFKFDCPEQKRHITIDYYDKEGLMLTTSVKGFNQKLSQINLWRQFFRIPFVTFKVTILIHWQALRLWAKGIKYIPKPCPPKKEMTR